ncbi:nitrogen regulation protein NR(I) [Simplicispira psychrophila]|uniref:nitrogen regulation protein NR(I) n=1 Tax=Simplicispira psychrophila TaxID=80882 RepID=UPI0004849A2A|nr:nitrogen regulation protein NR(I) [Simplicispira psychrophila]
MKPIWLVDDDPSIRFVLEKALAREQLPTRSFSHPQEVLAALASLGAGSAEGTQSAASGPQVLVSDIRMPGSSGLELLEQVHALQPGLPVIIMTAYSDLDSAVSAFQRGAFEYLPKPFDVHKAVALIRRAMQESEREDVAQDSPAASAEMLGQAPAMQDVFRAIGRLSASQVTVLITGESGTGKELVARALHRHSPVAGGPFVAINTAAIPKDLLESELFGHERGAFTGAQTQRRGRFEQAEGGTLFLDEIGDMPLDLQTRLLRVLSDGHFYRVGGHSSVPSHVRVVAATHQNLEQRVHEGTFREDLFHRLNVIRLRLPALRDRCEDVPMLTRHFLQHSARQLGVEPKRMSDAALARLAQFGFPGNVRQLENICHWLTVMAPALVVSLQDLPPEVLAATDAAPPVSPACLPDNQTVAIEAAGRILPGSAPTQPGLPTVVGNAAGVADLWEGAAVPPAGSWEAALAEQVQTLLAAGQPQVWELLTHRFEAQLITSALRATQGRRMEAAQRLGLGRNTITRKIQELGLGDKDNDKKGL